MSRIPEGVVEELPAVVVALGPCVVLDPVAGVVDSPIARQTGQHSPGIVHFSKPWSNKIYRNRQIINPCPATPGCIRFQ